MRAATIPIENLPTDYSLLPFRFRRIPGLQSVLLASESGEHAFVEEATLNQIVDRGLDTKSELYKDLLAKHFLYEPNEHVPVEEIAAQVRSRKAYLQHGPALHIIVVTLRCDHSCQYCQVSRQSPDKDQFDLPSQYIPLIVDRLFETRANELTVEFQGGEPLLAFDKIKAIVEAIERRREGSKKTIHYVIATTLHLLNDDILEFCKQHQIVLSTSLDGPAFLHNANRPTSKRNSYELTIAGIRRAREFLGHDCVSALTTITERSLYYPREIVDEYIRLGFDAIFLRPLSLYGFAHKQFGRIGYTAQRFFDFYQHALEYIIRLNLAGQRIEESYATLLLTHILTPFSTGYVDLRSPAGAGIGVLVYNYDGDVYPSDEARMLTEMGDNSLRLGHVSQPLSELLLSDTMRSLLQAGINETLPGCVDCAYRTYCGADPVDQYARTGDPIGHRTDSAFCQRHMNLFDYLFKKLHEADSNTYRVFLSWLRKRDAAEIPIAGYR